MFINFTSHTGNLWSAGQRAAASMYGDIRDIPFPQVDPSMDEYGITVLANECISKILEYKPSVVLCQGEMSLAFAVVSMLMNVYGITALAACSERIVTESVGEDGTTVKHAVFRFVRFRKYLA